MKIGNISCDLKVHYKLENNIVGDAIFRIKYGNVNYEITISRKHNERNVKGSIKFVGVCGFGHGQWDMEIQTYPRTTEIQLIGQHVCYTHLNIFRTIN